MSKKETEFDRVHRMKKMEREAEVEKRKNVDSFPDGKSKKGGKLKTAPEVGKRDWSRNYDLVLDGEYDYV